MHQVSFIRPCILTFAPLCVLRVYFISPFHPVQQIQRVTSIQGMPNLVRTHQCRKQFSGGGNFWGTRSINFFRDINIKLKNIKTKTLNFSHGKFPL